MQQIAMGDRQSWPGRAMRSLTAQKFFRRCIAAAHGPGMGRAWAGREGAPSRSDAVVMRDCAGDRSFEENALARGLTDARWCNAKGPEFWGFRC